MKRFVCFTLPLWVVLAGAGCGSTASIFGDGGSDDGPASSAPDLVYPGFALYRGVYVVSDDATNVVDGCGLMPNGAAPVKGQIWALVNSGVDAQGAGTIKLGNPSDPNNPSNPQNYDPTSDNKGDPPQAVQGEACSLTDTSTRCASEPGRLAFVAANANKGWLIRDNFNTPLPKPGNMCRFHRHLVNKLTLTSSGTFSADFSRTDDQHDADCKDPNTNQPIPTCTSSWTWKFKWVKDFANP